jgi:hypothetical protein
MIARIVILSVLALTFTVTGFAALWWASALSLEVNGVAFDIAEDDQEAWELRFAWLNMLTIAGGPLVGAGLIAAVGALALVVLRRQVAGTRTVSAPASTSARNPTTNPKSSPSSSNSSARSSRTSNVDAFR